MPTRLKPQAESIPAADGSTKYELRVGRETEEGKDELQIQVWIMEPKKAWNDSNGYLILIPPKSLADGLNKSKYEGIGIRGKTRGKTRWLNLRNLDTPLTDVFFTYENKNGQETEWPERITVDSERLKTTVKKYVSTLLG